MRRAFLTCLLVSAAAAPGWAQTTAGSVDAVARSELLYSAEEPEAAFDLLLEHVRSSEADFEAMWRLARAGVVVAFGIENNREQNRYLDPALHYARIAVEMDPERLDGRYWRGVAAGRRALNAAPSYASELAQIAYEDAHAILAVEPDHAGAHNLLGKLHYEVMSLSRLERILARLFMGNAAIREASWDEAEHHLARAVESAPDLVLFRYDLGALYEKRDRYEEAATHLREAVRLPAAEYIDAGVQEEAASLLERLGR